MVAAGRQLAQIARTDGAHEPARWAVLAKVGPKSLKEVHEALSSGAVAVIVVHVAAVIASSLLHRENLARAMLTGFKRSAEAEVPAESARWLIGALLLGAVVALWAGWIPVGQDGAHPTSSKSPVHRGADD